MASLIDADMADFKRKREKKVTPDTIRANFKSLNSAVNWAIKRKPPLLKTCPFSIPSVSGTGRKPFLPTEEILGDAMRPARERGVPGGPPQWG